VLQRVMLGRTGTPKRAGSGTRPSRRTAGQHRAGPAPSAAYMGDSYWFTEVGTLVGVPSFETLTFTHCLIDGTALAV